MAKLSRIMPLFLLLCVLCACGSKKADISAYGDTPITISGLADEDFTITPNELAQLECVHMSGTGKTAKSGSVSAVGPTLDTFLAQYGKTRADFTKVRFTASDKYVVALTGKHLSDWDIVLSVASGNNPLPDGEQPLRIFIPKAESSYWVYAVVKIEFFS